MSDTNETGKKKFNRSLVDNILLGMLMVAFVILFVSGLFTNTTSYLIDILSWAIYIAAVYETYRVSASNVPAIKQFHIKHLFPTVPMKRSTYFLMHFISLMAFMLITVVVSFARVVPLRNSDISSAIMRLENPGIVAEVIPDPVSSTVDMQRIIGQINDGVSGPQGVELSAASYNPHETYLVQITYGHSISNTGIDIIPLSKYYGLVALVIFFNLYLIIGRAIQYNSTEPLKD